MAKKRVTTPVRAVKMPKLVTVTQSQLDLAKLAVGGVNNPPKRPLKSAKPAAQAAFIEKYNLWAKEVKSQAKKGKVIKSVKTQLGNTQKRIEKLVGYGKKKGK